jgi:hypothetical protein
VKYQKWEWLIAAATVLQKYFSQPSLVFYFFPTVRMKLKLQLQIRERLLIATHLDQ